MVGTDICGSTVGFVGFGAIGQKILKRLHGFEVAEFLYTGHRAKPEGEQLGAKFVQLPELLKRSDFVILACPLTTETHGLFNMDKFRQMKPTSVLVNIARGEVVDQDALVTALRTNVIFAAGLDVMYPEPLASDHPLMSLPNACK
jgi:glyoxylate/hydroxypyruvate reductase